MLGRYFSLLSAIFILVSCQFTETLTLNEDGTGRMSLSVDLSDMMAMTGEMSKDSSYVKMDTIIYFKDVLEEKKDSIALLPIEEQKRFEAMENYNFHIITDPETKQMTVDVFIDFKDVSEANDLMKGFNQTEDLFSVMSEPNKEEEKEPEVVRVAYSYKKGSFKRDAYIVDKELHQTQLESMKQSESFMGGMVYKIKYTFPRKIKKASVEDASYSLDGKTIEFERKYLEFMKNPDIMDLEVELEK